ncbi:MAG: smalltalk protein [Bacteroidales bacterium]|nr:smalltalk protein [Bacteroidaceae bacterium]MBR3014236.1 smalltalk protein [Bacteroidaceae bacterium]MDO4186466.1 smalltalk protein [Bacteroidales bacterium]
MKNKRELLKYGIQLLIAILTAVGTSLGVSSCMSML